MSPQSVRTVRALPCMREGDTAVLHEKTAIRLASCLSFFCIVIRCYFDLKVQLTPKYFFCLNKSLHLFETHCVFLN